MTIFKKKITNAKGEQVLYWYAQVTDEYGVKHTRSSGMRVGDKGAKSKAREKEKELLDEVNKGRRGKSKLTVSEFAEQYLEDKRHSARESTYNDIRYVINKFIVNTGLKNTQLRLVEIDHVRKYRDKLIKDKKSKATIRKHLSFIQSFINSAIKQQLYFKPNPVYILGNPSPNNQRDRICTPEEEQVLLETTEKKWLRVAILLALYCGMRLNEIRLLKNEDVDLENNLIYSRFRNTKRQKREIVRRLPRHVKKEIMELQLQNGGGEYVLWGDRKFPKVPTFSKHFILLCKKAGIEGLTFHDFRHTCATRLRDAGYDIGIIKEVLGHSSVKMTDRYTHPTEKTFQAIDEMGERYFQKAKQEKNSKN